MRKKVVHKRIGKTYTFKWTITTNEQNIPLEGRDLLLEIKGPLEFYMAITELSIEGNTILFRFEGKDLKELGMHTVILWENKGKSDLTVVDTDAIYLVPRTCEED